MMNEIKGNSGLKSGNTSGNKSRNKSGNKSRDKRDVLIVDDTLFNRNLLARILTDNGFEVRTASNGESGLRCAREAPPELVLLDIRMPGMDGFEVCRRLKQDPSTRDIPVIFISALGEADAKVKAFDAGGIDYVTVPFEKKEVLARVGSHIELHRMRRRLEELVDQRTIELEDKAEKLQKEIEIRKKSEMLLREAQEIAHIGHWEMDIPTNDLTWSDEVFHIFEIDKEQFGASYEAFLDTIHPEDRDYVNREYLDSLKNKTKYDIVHRLLLKNGEIKYIHEKCRTEHDRENNAVRSMGTIQDITALKNAEIEKEQAERQLRQSGKMEAIGALAGGIAHDFNNILQAILGNAEMIEEFDPPRDENTLNDLKQVISGAYRARDLVDRILTFSRQTEKEKLPISLDSIIDGALKLIRATLPSTIRIDKRIDRIDGSVMADPTQMHQIMMNLCTNAAHAMGEKGGKLTIRLSQVDLDSVGAGRLPGLSPGRSARLSIRDTGHGVPREIMDRIFDPYFTTKKRGEGTGLGLSVVHGIVKDHNGAITAESTEGEGSDFIVFLPIMARETVSAETEAPEPVQTGAGRVLFVDDEKPLVDYGYKLLGNLGYEAVAETSSLEALELFRAGPDRFDLVITDMTMPDLTGLDLARELTRIRPDLPVILCTGFASSATPEKMEEAGVVELVSKPLSLRDLAGLVERYIKIGPEGGEG